MKRTLNIILILFIIPVFLCCFPTDYYNITDVDFLAVGETNEEEITLINEKLEFVVIPIIEWERCAQNHLQKLSNVCYATSRGQVLDNSLLIATFSICFDKPFQYKEDTILSGENLFNIENIKNEIIIEESKKYDGDIYSSTRIIFSDLFFQNANFENDYIVTFSCKTSDNSFFEKNISVTFPK